MKCLYLTSLYPCLSETFVAREVEYLSRLGWDVAIFRIRGKDKFSRRKILFSGVYLSPAMLNPVYWVRGLIWAFKYRRIELAGMLNEFWNTKTTVIMKTKLLLLLLTALGIAEYIENRELSFDHIRAHFLHTEALSAYWIANLIRVPYSITIHTRMIYYPISFIENVVKNASFCVGISNETVDLARHFRGALNGVLLIRNGVHLETLNREKVTALKPVVLAVGRLIPKKGFDVLIKACAALVGNNLDFICNIVGAGSEGHLLEKIIKENHLSEHVKMLGALPFEDVVDRYRNATVLVAPSRVCSDDIDGIPTVIIEALAMGIPVVTTPVGGILDLVENKKTGLIVPPDNDQALAKALSELLTDASLRDALALNGKRVVVDQFNIVKTAQKLNDVMILNTRIQ